MDPRTTIEAGQEYNNWTVLDRDFSRVGGCSFWNCKCHCGNIQSVRGNRLKSGKSKGCLSCATSKGNRKRWGKVRATVLAKELIVTVHDAINVIDTPDGIDLIRRIQDAGGIREFLDNYKLWPDNKVLKVAGTASIKSRRKALCKLASKSRLPTEWYEEIVREAHQIGKSETSYWD
jgi:hypothetical protein